MRHQPTCSPYCAIVHCKRCARPAVQGLDRCSNHAFDERGTVADTVAVSVCTIGMILVGLVLALLWWAPPSQSAQSEIVLTRHKVVVSSTLPSCHTEDGGDPDPCTWNVNPGDGNGQGLAYYVYDGRVTYVWTEDPRYDGQWVNGRMRRWLKVNYDWTAPMSCTYVHTSDDTSVVACANGVRRTINY